MKCQSGFTAGPIQPRFSHQRDGGFLIQQGCDILSLAASTAAGGLSAELPQWRMILVHFTPEKQAEHPLIIIAHHSLLDGLQGLELVNELTKSGNRIRERPAKKLGVNPFKKATLGTRFACYT